MNVNDINVLLSVGEHITLECKKADRQLPKSVWETYSSFANTIGGTIILGITEHCDNQLPDGRFEISGVDNASKIKKEIFDTLNSNKVSCNVLTDSDVEEISIEGRTIICINVPQADYRQRPVYINGNMLNGSYKRNYEGDYHCTEDEVKAMIRDANDRGNDSILMENYTMDDIDKPTLNAYRNRFNIANPDHVWSDYSDKEFLLNMGGYIIERNTQREGLTLAGLLMFGKGLSIRERFDNIRMDYLDMTNLQPGSRWSDRLTYDGRWENNLYNFFMKVHSKLVSDIKRPFRLAGTERIDDTPIHKAIREALTNCIIHSDYMITGVLRIEKHNDRFLFSNPGWLKIPVIDIYEGGHSSARNPNMQTMLRMIGFGDNIGSGFPTILGAWKKENWRKPILVERSELHLVELNLSMLSLISDECTAALLKIYGDAYTGLSKKEQLVLATAYTEGNISNYIVQLILDVNPLEAGKLLYTLAGKNMITSTNKGRWTTYSINSHSTHGIENSRGKTQGVTNSRGKTQGVTTSGSKRRQRITDLLIQYCSTPRTLQEIADEFNYSDKYRMKKMYIDPLLDISLKMTYEDSKTSPLQKYIAIDK